MTCSLFDIFVQFGNTLHSCRVYTLQHTFVLLNAYLPNGTEIASSGLETLHMFDVPLNPCTHIPQYNTRPLAHPRPHPISIQDQKRIFA
jgi:hypothetical protein